jgi:ribosomal protein S18 acetylase RimI-like enzyme
MNDLSSVKKIEASQGSLLRELRLAALREAPYAFGAKYDDEAKKPSSEFDADAYRHAMSEISTSFIYFVGSKPSGLIGAFFSGPPENRAFICSLWVHPQNRHLGGGRLLVRAACAWLVERGAPAIYAWVADANVAANKFYQALGFLPTKERMPLPSNPQESETLLVLLAENTANITLNRTRADNARAG